MTDAEALRIVSRLVAAFPRPVVNEMTVDVYVEALLPLDAARVAASVQRLTLTVRFLPTIAEIREAMTTQSGPELPTAGDAWATVLHWVRKIGGYGTVPTRTPIDRLIARCIDAVGGWHYLCHESENLMADRAHFLRVYAENVQRVHRHAAERVWPLPAPPERERVTDERTAAQVQALVSHVLAGGGTDVGR